MSKESYNRYFERNIGLLTEEEQMKLKTSTVGIAGIGGVGGMLRKGKIYKTTLKKKLC